MNTPFQLNKDEYIQSYQKMVSDKDFMDIAEEGMDDYLEQMGCEKGSY